MSASTPVREPRRRKNDKSEVPVSFLPSGNPPAKWAYLAMIVGLFPGLGIIFGPIALALGIVGGKVADRDEQHRGKGHARMSRLLGMLEVITNGAGWLILTQAS